MSRFIVTISAWTQPGCKDASKDPHESIGDDFQKALPGWCNTKKAAAIFLWLAFRAFITTTYFTVTLTGAAVSWTGTLVLTILDWRSGGSARPRDPPFTHPLEPSDDIEDDGDEESQYHIIPPVRRTTGDNSESLHSPFADTNRYSGASAAPSSGGYSGVSGAAPSAAPAMPRASMDAYGAFSDPAPTGYGAPTSPDAGPRVSRTMQYADPYAAVRASVAGQSVASTPPSYESYQGYR